MEEFAWLEIFLSFNHKSILSLTICEYRKKIVLKGFDNVKKYFQNSGADELNSVTDLEIYLW